MPRTPARKRSLRLLASVAVLAIASSGTAAYAALSDTGGAKRHNGDQTAEIAAQIKYGSAKNVILFIGDGMGDSEITVARNYLVGASGTLAGLDSLPLTGQYTTYALHKGDDPLTTGDDTGKPDYVTDSAASGTGWSTGTKSYNGAISVPLNGTTKLQTLLEWAKTQGKKTGDITTAEVQDATPAVQLAHVADRGCYMPGTATVTVDGKPQLKGTAKCPGQKSIEEQIVDTRADVVMGGGRGWFDAQVNGKSVYQAAKDAGYQVPETKAQMDALTTANQTTPVLGLFASGNFQTRYQATPATATGYQNAATKCVQNTTSPDISAPANSPWPGTQPTLAQMTTKSLQLLDNPNGFFLQVEGASIDKQDHAANPCGQVGETQDLDEAVQVGMEFAKTHGDTLVIVTADHAHTSQIINAADITGGTSVPLALTYNLLTADGTAETVAYGTAQSGGSQQHTGTQLRVAGYGPGAANVVGLSDQTDIFNTIKGALSGVGLDPAPSAQVVTVPGPTPPAPAPVTVTVPSKACAEAPAMLDSLKAKLKKAKKNHNEVKIARLEGRIDGVESLAKLC